MMLPHKFFYTNVHDEGLLDQTQIEHFRLVAVEHAREARLIGGTSTSLERAGTFVPYRLLDGSAVAEHLPELQRLYEVQFRAIAERVFGRELVPSPELVSGANVNILEGAGSRYEWHVDSNPYTGLLVLSPSSQSLGGRLLLGDDEDTRVSVSMSPGDLLFFDARQTPHAVEELRGAAMRATVPMNYFPAGEDITRPADLDTSLYSR